METEQDQRPRGERLFPVFFPLEKVRRGYILTSWDEGSVGQPGRWVKEIVPEDQINRRIGELLHVDKLTPEVPVVYRVETISEKTFYKAGSAPLDRLTDAKSKYVHFKTKNFRHRVNALMDLDKKTIEFYGTDAVMLTKAMGQDPEALQHIGGIAVLSYPYSNEVGMMVAKVAPDFNLLKATQKEILDWYDSHSADPYFTENPQTKDQDKPKK